MRTAARLALIAALAFVLGVTLSPHNNHTRNDADRVVASIRKHLYRTKISRRAPRHTTDVVSNVLLFAPAGFLGLLAFPDRRARVAAAGPLTSASIEIVQWLWLPHRAGSVIDFLANSIGYFIGLAVAVAVLSAHRTASLGRGRPGSAR